MQDSTMFALGYAFVILLITLCPASWCRSAAQSIRSCISRTKSHKKVIEHLTSLVHRHEVAAKFEELVAKDGAGSWPPKANHDIGNWPAPLRPYRDIYQKLASLLPQATPSLDDQINTIRVAEFRSQFQQLLHDRIELEKVKYFLEAADAGRWDIFPRDVYNAFYCCIAASRHAYRWGTIPVVKVAQLEKELELPAELTMPWLNLQRHFGCPSESGNNTSNIVLNFDSEGQYVYKINTGMALNITSGEEAFARIFYDVELLAVPIYHNMIMAIITFAQGDKAVCASHVAGIADHLKVALSSYFDNLHNQRIAHSVWLSRVQGFYAWGLGHYDVEKKQWDKYDGLSGNQVLLFQALDAFLGIEQYLSVRDQTRNVPYQQRAFCKALEKHSFRRLLNEKSQDHDEKRIVNEFNEILKRLRMFRTAHRVRAKTYLAQPAPERVPMTAGKSLLEATVEQSIEYLDGFMIKRLSQTV